MAKHMIHAPNKEQSTSEKTPTLEKVQRVAHAFENKVYEISKSQSEYARRIFMKLGGERPTRKNEANVSQSNTTPLSNITTPASVLRDGNSQDDTRGQSSTQSAINPSSQHLPLQVQKQGSEASLYVRPSASGLPHVPVLKTIDRPSGLINLSKNLQSVGNSGASSANYQSRHLQQGSIQKQSQPQILNKGDTRHLQQGSTQGSQVESAGVSASKQANISNFIKVPHQVPHQQPQSQQLSSERQRQVIIQTTATNNGTQQNQLSGKQTGSSSGNLVNTKQQLPGHHPQNSQQQVSTTGTTNPAKLNAWQERVYQKAQHLKTEYGVELLELRQKLTAELKQHHSANQNLSLSNNECDRELKKVVEAISCLNPGKDQIMPGYEEKLELVEKRALCMRYSKRTSKTAGSQPSGAQISSKVIPSQKPVQLELKVEPRLEDQKQKLQTNEKAPHQVIEVKDHQVRLGEISKRPQIKNKERIKYLNFEQSDGLQNRQKVISHRHSANVDTKTRNSANFPSGGPFTPQAHSVSVEISNKPVSESGPEHRQISEPTKSSPPPLICTPGMTPSPLLAKEPESSFSESAINRLVRAVKNISSTALEASACEVQWVLESIDRIPLPQPITGYGDDSIKMRARFSQNSDEFIEGQKMKRHRCLDSFDIEPREMVPTDICPLKRQRTEAKNLLMEEIRKINQQLIDTVVQISEGETLNMKGTVVLCFFSAKAASPEMKFNQPPVEPLRLFVPINYPESSPILKDKPAGFMEELGVSGNAKSKLQRAMRMLEYPTSLTEIARTWDICAREALTEYAACHGGGSFSSKYGAWEKDESGVGRSIGRMLMK
ncbi:hypothetical protein ACFE04_002582 [Oxalis oulophora]